MTQKSCAVGMRNAILRNHLKDIKGIMNKNIFFFQIISGHLCLKKIFTLAIFEWSTFLFSYFRKINFSYMAMFSFAATEGNYGVSVRLDF